MVNIWEYANSLPRVKLADVYGNNYVGNVIAVLDAEETEDTDDSIDIRIDGGEIKSFYPDEIKSIEVVE